jgi:hypothetical protein
VLSRGSAPKQKKNRLIDYMTRYRRASHWTQAVHLLFAVEVYGALHAANCGPGLFFGHLQATSAETEARSQWPKSNHSACHRPRIDF